MRNTFRANRQFERMLFNGIAEHPESVWQQNSHGLVNVRFTGRALSIEPGNLDQDKGDQLISIVDYGDESVQVVRLDCQ